MEAKTTFYKVTEPTIEQLAKYISNYYKNCPICSHEKFWINATETDLAFYTDNMNFNFNKSLSAYMIVCQQCGNLTQFSKTFLDKEISKQNENNILSSSEVE